MNWNWNPRGGHGVPTTGMTTPPTINQAQPSGCPPNQQHQFPTKLQHNWFKGAISELHGHIYDLVGIRSANLFTMTTCAIATYTGRELGGDICHSIETFTLATLICPTRPFPPPPATDRTIIPIDPVEKQLYAILWGQSTESIHAKVEAHPGFDGIKMESDCCGARG